MNKEDVTLSLKSFIRMKKQQCEMEEIEFGEEEALAAVMPVLESLLYTVSSGGKMDSDEEEPKVLSADMLSCIETAIQLGDRGFDEDDASDLFVSIESYAIRDGLVPDPNNKKPTKAKKNTVPTTNVDQFLKSLGNP